LIDAGTSAATAALAPGLAGAVVAVELVAGGVLAVLLVDELLPQPVSTPILAAATKTAGQNLRKPICPPVLPSGARQPCVHPAEVVTPSTVTVRVGRTPVE
jgi:hypothetical protein